MFLFKSKTIKDHKLVINMLHAVVDMKAWTHQAAQFSKWAFLDKMREDRADYLKQFSKNFERQGYRIDPATLSRAYEALVIEFSEWYYSSKKS